MMKTLLLGTDQGYRDRLVDGICNSTWTGLSQRKLTVANNQIQDLQTQIATLTAQLETANLQQEELRKLHQCSLLPKRQSEQHDLATMASQRLAQAEFGLDQGIEGPEPAYLDSVLAQTGLEDKSGQHAYSCAVLQAPAKFAQAPHVDESTQHHSIMSNTSSTLKYLQHKKNENLNSQEAGICAVTHALDSLQRMLTDVAGLSVDQLDQFRKSITAADRESLACIMQIQPQGMDGFEGMGTSSDSLAVSLVQAQELAGLYPLVAEASQWRQTLRENDRSPDAAKVAMHRQLRAGMMMLDHSVNNFTQVQLSGCYLPIDLIHKVLGHCSITDVHRFSHSAVLMRRAHRCAPAALSHIHVPRDYRSLQEAADVVPHGSTIVVAAGVYEAVAIRKEIKVCGWGLLDPTECPANVLMVTSVYFAQVYGAGSNGDTITEIVGGISIYGLNVCVRGCRITGSESAGVNIHAVDAIVENCVVINNAEAGVDVRDSGSSVTVRNCVISQNQNGVVVLAQGAVELNGCQILKNSRAGIGVRSHGSKATVRQCIISQNTECGMWVNDQGVADLWKCTVGNNGKAGIGVRAAGSRAVLRQSTIQNNYECGVWSFAQGAAEINGCTIQENARAGVEVRDNSSTATLQQSNISRNQNGIVVLAQGHIVLEGCKIIDNSRAGVKVTAIGTKATLRQCIISQNQECGVHSDEQCDVELDECIVAVNSPGLL